MTMIRNILVPTDLSTSSAPVMKTAGVLCEKLKAHVSFVNIVEEKLLNPFKRLHPSLQGDLISKSQEALERMIKDLRLDGFNPTAEVLRGEPFVEIISKSTLGPPADLILMGGGTNGGIHKLGHNAFKVLQMGPSHTFVVKNKNGQAADKAGFERILAAVDFSEHSYLALEHALLFKSIFGGKLEVLQVVPSKDSECEDRARKKLQEHLTPDRFREIDRIEVKCSDRTVQDEILHEIDQAGIDLLVIGSHGEKRFMRNIFLGDVAYDVVRKADCSVVVLKLPPQEYAPPDLGPAKGYL